MLGSTLQVRLPRRITAYFLLFGLAALVWLSFGAVYVARSVTDSRSEGASLRWLGRGCDRVALGYLRDKQADLQPIRGGDLRAKRGQLLRGCCSHRRMSVALEPRPGRKAGAPSEAE